MRHESSYTLNCNVCGAIFIDDGSILECPNRHRPSLLVSNYGDLDYSLGPVTIGLKRYGSWLPTDSPLEYPHDIATFQSEPLCKLLSLPNLWITFSGYLPRRGSTLKTATFKELEAYSVLSRMSGRFSSTIVVASAGSTAAAFAELCSRFHQRCLLIVPQRGLTRIRTVAKLDTAVKIVSLTGGADYCDAIELAEAVSRLPGFKSEGGIRNVGRRDGLGIPLLNAVEQIGHIPDYYFQAVGSGAGAIATIEASSRLIKTGRCGTKLPRLMLSQNLPFTPICNAWNAGSRELLSADRDEGKIQISQIVADVLSNQSPPYSIQGGVYDSLCSSNGSMYQVDNAQALHAIDIFKQCEGVEIDAAAAVALASLIQAKDAIRKEATIQLHLTGGGRSDVPSTVAQRPHLELDRNQLEVTEAALKISHLCSEI